MMGNRRLEALTKCSDSFINRMIGHDIIVIGSSAGGIKALSTIVTNLSADINAAILSFSIFQPIAQVFFGDCR